MGSPTTSARYISPFVDQSDLSPNHYHNTDPHVENPVPQRPVKRSTGAIALLAAAVAGSLSSFACCALVLPQDSHSAVENLVHSAKGGLNGHVHHHHEHSVYTPLGQTGLKLVVEEAHPDMTWSQLKSDMDRYMAMRNTQIQFNELITPLQSGVSSTAGSELLQGSMPHVAAISHVVPSNIEEWKDVHWTAAFTRFVHAQGKAEEYNLYQDNEVLRKYRTFRNNAKDIVEHNSLSMDYSSYPRFMYTLETNKFADIESWEMRSFGLTRSNPGDVVDAGVYESSGTSLPGSWDWRNKGCVQEVKNQMRCGSCWAFSAVESVESAVCAARTKHYGEGKLRSLNSIPSPYDDEYDYSHYYAGPVSPEAQGNKYPVQYKRSEHLPNLSEQELVDCAGTTGNMGCHGGLMEMAFEYMKGNGGMCTEKEYAYKGEESGECDKNLCAYKADWKVSDWKRVRKFSNSSLQNAIYENGVVAISIQADRPMFRFYSGGVIHDVTKGLLRGSDDENTCGVHLDHGVAVVGWGDDGKTGEPYWIVKNSWSDVWGEKGFVRIARDTGGIAGECGILLDASFPVIDIVA